MHSTAPSLLPAHMKLLHTNFHWVVVSNIVGRWLQIWTAPFQQAVLSLGDARACGDLANDKKNQREGIRSFSELTLFEGANICPCVVAFAGGVPVERCLEIDQVASFRGVWWCGSHYPKGLDL